MTNAIEIARKLTPAQKRALMWLEPSPTRARRHYPGAPREVSLFAIADKYGLCNAIAWREWWCITDKGVAVREALKRQEPRA